METSSLRILITGSRFWNDEQHIRRVLGTYRRLRASAITLVSGACPPRTVNGIRYKGADRICEEAARSFGWSLELHPADWGQFGSRAGFIRNKEMVDLGASLCIAFILNGSAGASMCANLAENKGIRTFREEVWTTEKPLEHPAPMQGMLPYLTEPREGS